MKKLDSEPRLQGAAASVVEWARKVAQSVNGVAAVFAGDVLKIANGGTSASTAVAARAALGVQLEPGVVAYTAASTPPPGWLKRNGAAVSRTVYAGLFSAIGTTYGAGNGSTTFNLPDDRGLVDRGWDEGRGYDPGRAFGSEQGDAIREISGGWTEFYGGISEASGYGAFVANVGVTGAAGNNISVNKASGMTFAASRQVPVASEVRVKSRAYLPIIKY